VGCGCWRYVVDDLAPQRAVSTVCIRVLTTARVQSGCLAEDHPWLWKAHNLAWHRTLLRSPNAWIDFVHSRRRSLRLPVAAGASVGH
jgi:hypothetical protein